MESELDTVPLSDEKSGRLGQGENALSKAIDNASEEKTSLEQREKLFLITR